MLSDGERRRRLSALCKRLRGDESLRSFTKKRAKELQGISHSSWSAWESKRAGLSSDSLDKFANFIGCSHQSLFAYLDGSKTLDELLQPNLNIDDSEEQFTLSGNAAVTWMESLSLSDKFLIASQGFNLLRTELDKLIEEKAEKLAQQKAKQLVEQENQKLIKDKASEFEEEVIREIAGERAKLLVNLLSGTSYPNSDDIAKVAQKLNLRTEDLIELCNRLYPNKSKKKHERGNTTHFR